MRIKPNLPVDQIKLGLLVAALAAFTGCVGYVDGGYSSTVFVPGPDVYLFGGGYERREDVHVYSHRGYESRVVVHPSLPHVDVHPVGHGHENKH